jgi:cytochrome oxidase assembly protein ShyY1
VLTALRTRRWQAFTALVLVAIIGFGFLSRWQWARADEKRLAQQAQELADQQAIVPSPTDQLSEFTAVQVSGTYVSESRRLVRQRPLEGRNGYWVLELLRSDVGDLWVMRGWVPAGTRTDQSPEISDVDGPVTVEGIVRPLPEGRALEDRRGLPLDQVTDIEQAQLPEPGNASWFIQARSSTPSDDITVVPVTRPDEIQNVSYAVQWLLFAAVAIGGWFYFLRRESKEMDESG